MPLPMQVARYLYFVTLIPTASAVPGFSPTARRERPTFVRNSTQLAVSAMTSARKNRIPMPCSASCRSAKGHRYIIFGPIR